MLEAGLRRVGVDSAQSDSATPIATDLARAGSLFGEETLHFRNYGKLICVPVIPGQDHVFKIRTAPLSEDWVISQDSDISHYIELLCINNSSS